MPQFQVHKKSFEKSRIISFNYIHHKINKDEILVKIESFAYTSNNITYAVAANAIGYWMFFPPVNSADQKNWGVIPVWGFAKVIKSNHNEIHVNERLYGFFQPASHLIMKVAHVNNLRLVDSSSHRQKLPAGYNIYNRVSNDPKYKQELDALWMLLYPLHVTSFCLWDALKDRQWYGAEQVIILSASSKTSIGLGKAIFDDKNSPITLGVTSEKHVKSIYSLNLYDEIIRYKNLAKIDVSKPSVIVDMSGNHVILLELYERLGVNMKYCLKVGLTHWEKSGKKYDVLKQKSEFFFAPNHIQKRINDWGISDFHVKTGFFLKESMEYLSSWIDFDYRNGLESLQAIHSDVVYGKINPKTGLIINM